MICKDMGLDYEEYAKELSRLEVYNEQIDDYQHNDIKNINQESEEQNQAAAEPNIQNRRMAREAPKPKKEEKDEWGDDIEDDLNL